MKKAVIFDLDDTLILTYEDIWRVYKKVGKEQYDLDLSNEDLRAHWGEPFPQIAYNILKGVDTIENIVNHLKREHVKIKRKPAPFAIETIKRLKNKYLEVCILTGCSKELTIENLKSAGFNVGDFLVIQASDDTEVHKPDPNVFHPILERLREDSINKDEIIYVGDSLVDYHATRGAGIDFVSVLTGIHGKSDFDEVKSLSIDNLSFLIEIVESYV